MSQLEKIDYSCLVGRQVLMEFWGAAYPFSVFGCTVGPLLEINYSETFVQFISKNHRGNTR